MVCCTGSICIELQLRERSTANPLFYSRDVLNQLRAWFVIIAVASRQQTSISFAALANLADKI